jgi:L-ascorbate metabolism protein UlaG (beta-lactamase superfamily)
MLFLAILILVLAGVTYLFLGQTMFGRAPEGARLEQVKRSPHFADGEFKNRRETPTLTEGYTYAGVMYEFMLGGKSRKKPSATLPSKKIDLKALRPDDDVLVWFGHSSYFIQIDGKRVLVDPVLSGAASPIRMTTPAFDGTDPYAISDVPDIDYVFISHDHWDHLDHKTLTELQPRIGKIICGLGVGEHLELWGFTKDQIIEQDWQQKSTLADGFISHTFPARHFSGRGFTRNKTLWASYVLQTPTMKIYIGGDSGYDTHFAEIGKEFGSIDLAILENGQYDKAWKYLHMLPEEVPLAANDLNAKRVLAVHSSKFTLANHAWDEPLILASKNAAVGKLPLITPMIGERVDLKDQTQRFTNWWEGID